LVDTDGHLVSLVSISELVARLVDDGTTLDLRRAEPDGASHWFG
jgi:hypothetical protein